jgi:hypothetical protein
VGKEAPLPSYLGVERVRCCRLYFPLSLNIFFENFSEAALSLFRKKKKKTVSHFSFEGTFWL